MSCIFALMTTNPAIFKSYDIRGIYPTDLDEEGEAKVIQAIYTFFTQKTGKQNLTVALGRDMRISGPALFEVAKKTLIEMGAQVIDLGLLSTPTFYFAVSHFGYDTGIQVTASHNPKEYTGLKFVINSPKGLIKIGKPTGMEDIKSMVVNGFTPVTSDTPGSVEEKHNIVDEEVTSALTMMGNPSIKKFKIVADPANAMGGVYLEALFKQVDAEVIWINKELDGTFPAHQPDPLQPKNLIDAQNKVRETGADLGLVPDGDGDRMMFINEKGELIPPTMITALVARDLLKSHPGETILVDIRYILTPQKIVEEFGGKTIITKVGHAFITEEMHKSGGIFAGESSGHYFFRETGNAESQVPMVLFVLKAMSEEGKPVSEIVEELRRSYESGEINFTVSNAPEIIEGLKQKYSDGEQNTMDGIAISYPDWRLSVRTSNTEPLLRLNVESYTKDKTEEKKNELVAYIQSMGGEIAGGH